MATFIVNTLLDENNGVGVGAGTSLREAIIAANSNADANDIIQLQGGETYKLTLQGREEDAAATGDLDITSGTILIQSVGTETATIDAQTQYFNDDIEEFSYGIDRVLDVHSGTLKVSKVTIAGGLTGNSVTDSHGGGIRVNAGAAVEVTDSIIRGNGTANAYSNSLIQPNGDGAGIWNAGTATITRSTISGNLAGESGGGIVNAGFLAVTDSTISGHQPLDNYTGVKDGAGIDNRGQATISGSTISDNFGLFSSGGIRNLGTMRLANSTISGNIGGYDSGGIQNRGTMVIDNSVVRENVTGYDSGGIQNEGTMTISNSTIDKNIANGRDGGGIVNLFGILTIANSTISNNVASQSKGGIWNIAGTVTIADSTITGNSGNGIENSDTIAISNSTITLNEGSGITNLYDRSLATLTSSIISGNSGSSDVETDSGTDTFVSNGHNLIGNIGTGIAAFSQPTDITGVTDPKLAPLANNGGPTQTHALLPDSPAFNAGSNPNNSIADQRGTGFTRNFLGPDIGAFEAQPTSSGNALQGTHKNDVIQGLGGNDTIAGSSGNDELQGNAGSDYLAGNTGNDTIFGGSQNDTLAGGTGDDVLRGATGNDLLFGDRGADTLTGANLASGGVGEQDTLAGGSGADRFVLGDSIQAYYVGGGASDFAQIADFTTGDRIQLQGTAANYTLQVSGGNTQILRNGDTIAIAIAVTGLRLTNTNHFLFV
jgi:RTX calcium-binding nonapeptide repeat (4 copies)